MVAGSRRTMSLTVEFSSTGQWHCTSAASQAQVAKPRSELPVIATLLELRPAHSNKALLEPKQIQSLVGVTTRQGVASTTAGGLSPIHKVT